MPDCIRRTALRLHGLIAPGPGRHRAGSALARTATSPARAPRPRCDDDRTVEFEPFTLVRPYMCPNRRQAVPGGAL